MIAAGVPPKRSRMASSSWSERWRAAETSVRAGGAAAAGNEQMQGGPAVRRAQLPGGFIGDTGADAVAEKTERHRHQRRERLLQPLHQRAHGGEGRLVKARGAARQLHRTKVDLGWHEAPQGSVKRGISSGVREGEQAAADGGAVIAKWDPPLERHCVHRIRAATWLRTVPHQESTRKSARRKLGPDMELRRPAVRATAFRGCDCQC